MSGIKIKGEVVGGNRIGRKLGFPTANIELSTQYDTIKDGVYAVRVCVAGEVRDGMANIGYKPSVAEQPSRRMLEVNIFGFGADLYGHDIEVELLHFVRTEMTFANLEELKSQVNRDRQTIQDFFKTLEN